MNHEDFVTYEQAVKLKELGFDWGCIGFYDHYKIPSIEHYYIWNESKIIKENYNDDFIAKTYNVLCSAPTLAQAQKWLREVKDVNLVPNFKFHKGKVKYSWYIVTDNGDRGICDDIEKSIFDTYEQALSVGIDSAIELLKQQSNGNQD